MPEVSNHGVKISYEVSGQGRPLVLLHGWVMDHSWWSQTGYVDDLQRDHRVINVDWRGHGESDKPLESAAYRGEAITSDVLAVADAEGVERFALWGISYGGLFAWRTAFSAPDRVAALIASGNWDPTPGTYEDWVPLDEGWREALRRGGTPALLELMQEEEEWPFPAWAKAMWLRADPQALLASTSSELFAEGPWTLEGFPVPALLITGEIEDKDGEAPTIARMLPNGESLVLPGLGHLAACAASGATIPHVRAFLDRWFV